VKLTKGDHVYTMPLTVGLDRRVSFTVADRKLQYEAAKRVSGLFARMSSLAAKIVAIHAGAMERAGKLPDGDPLAAKLKSLADDADDLRKKIVATTEGGAITGEERLREHLDYVYGAIMSVEDKPTPYAIKRVDVLERELRDVETSFDGLSRGKLAQINTELKSKGLEQIALNEPVLDPPEGGGRAEGIARDLVGLRLFDPSTVSASQERNEKD
jgi:hypothetical protein